MTNAPKFRRGGDLAALRSAAKTAAADPAPAPSPAAPERPAGVRANKYGGRCSRCSVWVPEGQGTIEKSPEGKWLVMHIQPCPEQGTAVAAATEPSHQANTVAGQTLFDGIYTYETATAHRTFRLRTQALDDSFMPGAQIISHLTGPDNDSDYEKFGSIRNGRLAVWRRFADRATLVKDAEAFLANPHDALQSATCFRCGRTLTVPASITNGYGPECSKKGM